jgi:predicted amidohydrolase YtcJ
MSMAKWLLAGFAMLAATVVFGAEADTFALVNGRIYTENVGQPWAKALVVKDERIAYVGESGTAEWNRLVGPATPEHDLKNHFVVPGFIDAHTHPALTAMWGSGDPKVDAVDMMPAPGRAETFKWLRRYAKAHPGQELVVLGAWDGDEFQST